MPEVITHHGIISRVGGVAKLRAALLTKFPLLSDATVRSWASRNSIPPEYWHYLVDAGIATFEELAKAIAKPVASLPEQVESGKSRQPEASRA